jgi:hypothetical protein
MRWSSARLTDIEVDAETSVAANPERLRQGDFSQSRLDKVFRGGHSPSWLRSRNGSRGNRWFDGNIDGFCMLWRGLT